MIATGHVSTGGTYTTRGVPVPTIPQAIRSAAPDLGREPIRHGTVEGYWRHTRVGEAMCGKCLEAARATAEPPAPAPTKEGAACGTYGGYMRHRRSGTPVCDDCQAARAAYRAEYRQRAKAAKVSPRAILSKPKPPRPPSFDVPAAWADYQTGMSARDVAAKHGVAYATLTGHLKAAGHKLRSRTRPVAPEMVTAILTAYTAGETPKTIAARHGCSPSLVHKVITQTGTPTHRQNRKARP